MTRGLSRMGTRVGAWVGAWVVSASLALTGGAGMAALAGSGGTAELRLSRAALEELISPATERTVPFRFPGLGEVQLRIGRAEEVRLLDGAVEARVPVSVAPGGAEGGLRVQLKPVIDRKSGRLWLRTVRTTGEGALAGMPDLAQALPTVELPRAFEQIVKLEQAPGFRLSVYLQGIEIDPDGVELEFLVKTGPLHSSSEGEPEREKGARLGAFFGSWQGYGDSNPGFMAENHAS